jgi:hypothetical protein
MNTDMKVIHPIIILTLVFMTFRPEDSITAQGRCESCARHGILEEFLNPDNPDYEERLKQFDDCVRQSLGNNEHPDGIPEPEMTSALEKCRSLEPPESWYCYPSLMSVYIGERFTGPCFHLISPLFYSPETDKPPEYIFKGSYEANLKGGRIIEYAEDYKKPVIAKMELRLYYNGNSPELVMEWSSENTINDPRALFNKLKTPESLNPLLEDFERKPVNCEVRTPDPEVLCEHDTGVIILSGFKDKSGNPSREFNRIVVQVSLGTILNGEDCNFGPDRKVFNTGDGTIRVAYRPPVDKEDGFERLRIYNSCDILPPEKDPYENTLPGELIADEKFPIICTFDAILKVTGSYKKTEKSIHTENNDWGNSESTFDLNESRQATFYVPLQLENSFDVEILNQKFEYYRPLDINLSSFNANFRSREYRSSIGSGQGSKTTILKSKVPTSPGISLKETMLQTYIVMTVDINTGKVRKIDIDGFNVEFSWEQTVDSHTETWWQPPPNPGHETIDRNDTDTEDDSFHVGPVGEPVPDPVLTSGTETVKTYLKDMGVSLPGNVGISEEESQKIEPDLLVRFGDRKTHFGGSGERIVDNSSGSTVHREEFTFSWQATRKEKQ